MTLKILLPSEVFALREGVSRIVAETLGGSLGILPHRLDCVAVLKPGIFTFETADSGESFVAVDEGVLVKEGSKVFVSVRNAIGGTELGELREAVARQFLGIDERERKVRSALARLESGFLRRFAGLHRE